jgi:hypothetical protein
MPDERTPYRLWSFRFLRSGARHATQAMQSAMAQAETAPRKIGWLEALSGRYWRAPTVIALIAANLVPLYGVVHWGWDLFVLMTAHWLETGIIGFYTAVRMAIVGRWAAAFLLPFFCIHFGGFMAGHFFFLWALFADEAARQAPGFGEAMRRIVLDSGLWVAVVAMFISHGVSFYLNFLKPWRSGRLGADPKNRDLDKIMMTPYGRVVVMHLTILFGAALMQVFQTKAAAFVLLIALKVTADIAAHVRTNFSEKPS